MLPLRQMRLVTSMDLCYFVDKGASTPVAHNATCYGRELAVGDAMNAHHALRI